MKPYSDKPERLCDKRCLFSEIRKQDKPRKKAKRREGKSLILKTINNE